jgi:hypothetical protein
MKEISGWLGGATTGKEELKYSYLMSGGLCMMTIIGMITIMGMITIGHTLMKPKWSVDSWVIVYKVSDMLLYQYAIIIIIMLYLSQS